MWFFSICFFCPLFVCNMFCVYYLPLSYVFCRHNGDDISNTTLQEPVFIFFDWFSRQKLFIADIFPNAIVPWNTSNFQRLRRRILCLTSVLFRVLGHWKQFETPINMRNAACGLAGGHFCAKPIWENKRLGKINILMACVYFQVVCNRRNSSGKENHIHYCSYSHSCAHYEHNFINQFRFELIASSNRLTSIE